jgi:tRNA1(Val) A37 N6-methylase TrmN6
MSTTVDFLDGKVTIIKDQRFDLPSSDTVFLAAAAPVKPGQTVLDVGMGNGILALLLHARVHNLTFTGVEIDDQICATARQNATLNKVNMTIINDDVSQLKLPELFDHVISNPPFFTETVASPKPARGIARTQMLPLELWLTFCLKRLAPKGTFTFMHKTDLLPKILHTLQNNAMGKIEIIPIFSKRAQAANRIIIRAVKNSRTYPKILPGIIVHNDDGSMTAPATAILRRGTPL